MIGFFDSGSGGLTVLRALREELPSADVLYFGDIKNAPYGLRTPQELSLLALQDIQFLLENGATSIVNACNSASATLALSLLDTFDLTSQQMIEMVGPTVSAFRGFTGRVALTGTVATIHSGTYQSAFSMIGKDVHAIPIPNLGGAIEAGGTDAEIEKIISDAFKSEKRDFDVLVLACTHYPLVIDVFKKVLPGVSIFDPASAVAARARKQFWPREVGDGNTRFVISKDSRHFREVVKKLFPNTNYSIEVVQ